VTFKTIVAEERHAIPLEWRRVLAKFPNDLWDAWEERAAIIQYDGQEPRPTAERRAFECITRAYEEAAALLRDHLDSAPAQSADPSVRPAQLQRLAAGCFE
jgi:hypothetical protein